MKRPTFIMLLGSAVAWPLDAFAQQRDKVWRMGFIAHGHESFWPSANGSNFDGQREIDSLDANDSRSYRLNRRSDRSISMRTIAAV